jgi:hypothetical protein
MAARHRSQHQPTSSAATSSANLKAVLLQASTLQSTSAHTIISLNMPTHFHSPHVRKITLQAQARAMCIIGPQTCSLAQMPVADGHYA